MASVAVLGLLALIAAGVAVKQAHFTPAVTEALEAAQAAGAGAGAAGLLASLPAGLEPMSAPERFDAATLSDKIDGRAELYLAAGCAGLRAQRVRLADDRETWFEVFMYDMKGARNAFSVFSAQRREGMTSLAFVRYGYRTANSICLVQGGNYIEIVASRPGAGVMKHVEALARLLAPTAAAGGEADLGEAGLFPPEGMVPASVQLITANAFSFGRLDNIFAARYRDGGTPLTLYLSKRASAREAANLSAAYRRFLVELDGKEASAPAGTWLVDLDGSFEGGFTAGRLLGGVHQAGSEAVARRQLARLRAALEGKAP